MKTSKETRARLRELLSKTSPGPWKTGTHSHDKAVIEGPLPGETPAPWVEFKIFDEGGHTEEDAALITESRNALGDLLDDLEELESEVKWVSDAFERAYKGSIDWQGKISLDMATVRGIRDGDPRSRNRNAVQQRLPRKCWENDE